jgi:putative SOS response-associated peptidase YedK
MCGRFVQLGPPEVYITLLGIEAEPGTLAPRYNVAPTS